jgi:hypothetical protein
MAAGCATGEGAAEWAWSGRARFPQMAPLACLMHWYISMLYVVPVLAVGGWGWWSSKRMARRKAAGTGYKAARSS